MAKTVIIQVEDFDELRDSLHQTGLFEMSDCAVEITCSLDKKMNEVNKIFDFVKSVINVIDTNLVTDDLIEGFRVKISEETPPYLRNPGRKRSI